MGLLFVPVKRQILFFAAMMAFAVIVLASYGSVGAWLGGNSGGNQAGNHAPWPPLAAAYFYDKSDKQVTLDDFKGRVVLVNLWATWCTPCLSELPALDHLQKLLPADKFQIVAIAMDTKLSMKDIAEFLKKHGVKNLAVYWDKDRQLPLKWQYDGLPTSFLLDRDGNIVARYDGPYQWDEGKVLDEIKSLVLK